MVNIIEDHDLKIVDVNETISKILDMNPDLDRDGRVLIINNPFSKMMLSNEDHEVLEPLVLQDIVSDIISEITDNRYSFVLMNNLESYVVKNQNREYIQHDLVNFNRVLETLDSIHIETYVMISNESYNHLLPHFEMFL